MRIATLETRIPKGLVASADPIRLGRMGGIMTVPAAVPRLVSQGGPWTWDKLCDAIGRNVEADAVCLVCRDKVPNADGRNALAIGDRDYRPLDKHGAVMASIDSYANRIIARIGKDGSVKAKQVILEWRVAGPARIVQTLSTITQEALPIPRKAKMRPSAEYDAMGPEAAHAAIAADFESMVNKEMPDPLVSGLEDPLIAPRPLTFSKGSEEALRQAIITVFLGCHRPFDAPIAVEATPSENGDYAWSGIKIRESPHFFARSCLKECEWEHGEIAMRALSAAARENPGSGWTTTAGSTERPALIFKSKWTKRPLEFKVVVDPPTAHERLQAMAALDRHF